MSAALGQVGLSISGMLFASLWEGAIIVAAVWLFLRVFPGLGASTRYAVWLAALAMLAIAPVCTLALAGHQQTPAAVSALDAGTLPNSKAATAAAPVSTPTVVAAAGPERKHIDISLGFSAAIGALWLLAAGLRLGVLVMHLRGLAVLARSAEILRSAFGYPVLVSERTSVPLAIGFLRPAVVLPVSLSAEISDEAFEAIVMHEVAHLRRYDVWTNALARVLEALLVLNPFAWFALARLSAEREIACDDWVVARLDAGEVFASALANLVCRPAFRSIAAPSAIGSKHAVVTRIEQLLDRRPRNLRLSAPALASTVLLLAIFASIVPSFSPVLAFAAQPSAMPGTQGCNRPALVEGMNMQWQGTGRWAPLTFGSGNVHDPRNTVIDLTIDAKGKLSNATVISSPHERDAIAAKRLLARFHYQPAMVNCKAVASTKRLAINIDIAPPAVISVVRADYPSGWSAGHPGACRVPDLVHAGVPDVTLVTTESVTASVLVHVNGSGNITSAALTRSSGNAEYDKATLAAARGATYPLGDGFKPVRPNGAPLSWNATHGYSRYSKCAPLPAEYTWTTTFPAAEQ